MIKEKIRFRRISANICEEDVIAIKNYLQGAVYCWCKNCKDENQNPLWFSARDLFGGDNYYWQATPLYVLFTWHKNNGAQDPVNMAGKDVGHLLRDVLFNDKRLFDTRKPYTREYLWDGIINLY